MYKRLLLQRILNLPGIEKAARCIEWDEWL
jgi:hypothetical protein